MTQIDRQASNSQKYISSKTSYTANQVVYILNDDTTIREIKIPKNIQYLYYTSADVDSSYKFSTTAGSNSNTSSNYNSDSNTSSNDNSDSNTFSNDNSDSDSNSFHLNINILYLFFFVLFI